MKQVLNKKCKMCQSTDIKDMTPERKRQARNPKVGSVNMLAKCLSCGFEFEYPISVCKVCGEIATANHPTIGPLCEEHMRESVKPMDIEKKEVDLSVTNPNSSTNPNSKIEMRESEIEKKVTEFVNGAFGRLAESKAARPTYLFEQPHSNYRVCVNRLCDNDDTGDVTVGIRVELQDANIEDAVWSNDFDTDSLLYKDIGDFLNTLDEKHGAARVKEDSIDKFLNT